MSKAKQQNNIENNKPKIGKEAKNLISKQIGVFFKGLATMDIWNMKITLKPISWDVDLEPWFKFDRDRRWILKETDKFVKTSRYFGNDSKPKQIIKNGKVTNPRMFVAVSDSLYEIYLRFYNDLHGGRKLPDKRFRAMFEKRYNVKIHQPRYHDTDKRIYKITSQEYKNEMRRIGT